VSASQSKSETQSGIASHGGNETQAFLRTTQKGLIEMITKEELKKRYDGKTITELETMAKSSHTAIRERQSDLVCVLYYLKASGRYKENRRYAKVTFWEYLEDVFSIRKNTFIQWANAVINWPDEVKKHGIGLVTKVASNCSATKRMQAFKAIDKLVSETAKEGPALREKIENVINTYRAKPPIKKSITDWRAMYEREAHAHTATKGKLREAYAEIVQLKAQIDKLKDTAHAFGQVRSIFENIQREARA